MVTPFLSYSTVTSKFMFHYYDVNHYANTASAEANDLSQAHHNKPTNWSSEQGILSISLVSARLVSITDRDLQKSALPITLSWLNRAKDHPGLFISTSITLKGCALSRLLPKSYLL